LNKYNRPNKSSASCCTIDSTTTQTVHASRRTKSVSRWCDSPIYFIWYEIR